MEPKYINTFGRFAEYGKDETTTFYWHNLSIYFQS